MLKSHEKFHSVNGKRLVLVVDDELVNREILGNILKDDYEVIYAADGKEALTTIREHAQILCLILLDLLMPEIDGLELLKMLKADPDLSHIPVMVMTSEKKAEVESLKLGASDFLTKPYSQPEVVLARVLKTIELSEDREIIQSTERDPLTGLYTREYFFSYADQYDHFHKDKEMDAIVVDINHFHMINERYGKDYGDQLLKAVGEELREALGDGGGIVCRRAADTFLIYCPHREDYLEILESIGKSLEELRLRMGVYQNCDRTIDIERRFDRAKLAADRIRHDFSTSVAYYDKSLHDAQLFSERLLEDFPRAIREHEFHVYYQPKYDIRSAQPMLASAEALVRWIHPELGFINPGVFVPLFEENSLVQQLDHYVWEEAAAQIRKWKDRYGLVIPISVNMSRIDMYDPKLRDKLMDLMNRHGIRPEEFDLEITESAYTEDSEQIVDAVNRLRELGFRIEMDDFGTGYSSLNMVSELPIDVLKIDMLFIRSAFRMQKDVRMLELIMEIADYISVPVVAEGVETEEQMETLKALGCDYVQGYYFSKPVPPEEFDLFVEQKQKVLLEKLGGTSRNNSMEAGFIFGSAHRTYMTYARIAQTLAREYFSMFYIDMDSNEYVEYSSSDQYKTLPLIRDGKDFFAETQENIRRVIFEEDREKALSVWNRDFIANVMEKHDSYSVSYRMMVEGQPTYINFKVLKVMEEGSNHIVVGIRKVEELAL